MILFLTSSPCIYKHSPATLTEANGFLRRIKSKLPPKPRALFVASSPAEHDKTDFYSGDMAGAFERAGIPLPGWQILDDLTADRARELIAWSDFIILMCPPRTPFSIASACNGCWRATPAGAWAAAPAP